MERSLIFRIVGAVLVTIATLFAIDAFLNPQALAFEYPFVGIPILLWVGAPIGGGSFAMFGIVHFRRGAALGVCLQLVVILIALMQRAAPH
jgi:hypothetical protein